MNFDAFKRELIRHYVEMARLPGAIEQARHSCRRFAADFPEQFRDLEDLVRAELQKND